jgi:hypothetical protein
MDNVGLVIVGYGLTTVALAAYVTLLRRRAARARERAVTARRAT